jgi:CRP-like cAMP-binding protein
VAELSRIGLLAELPGGRLRELATLMEREEIPPGRSVVREGEQGDRFYIVLSGLLAVSSDAFGARRLLRPGSYFGEVALAIDVPRTASVTAMMRSTVASCDRKTFEEFVLPLFADDREP